jgi:Flp pilus assembly protein TadD
MARAAAKGRKRPEPDARSPRKRSGRRELSAAEQGLFFSRIRTHAKWAFVLLAVVFAATFAFAGVGTGNNDLSQLFQDIFRGGGSSTSVSKALDRTNKNPNDAKAWRDLATAYQEKGRLDDAIAALTTYTGLKPKDATAFSDLGSLQLSAAQNAATAAAPLQAAEAYEYAGTTFEPASTTGIGKALGGDPIEQALQTRVSTRASDAQSKIQTYYSGAVSTYKQLAKLRPNDSTAWLSLDQAAEQAGDAATAIQALKKVAKLEPDQAAQIKARIKALESSSPG